jgi:hypothetical protein
MNVVIHKHGSDKIKHFVKDCVRKGNNFYGSNMKMFGCKPRHYDYIWTEDDANPIFDAEGHIIDWDKLVSEMTPSPDPPVEATTITPQEYSQAFKIRQLIDTMSYQDVEDYINANVTDLASARTYIIRLSKVVLALAKIADKEGQ